MINTRKLRNTLEGGQSYVRKLITALKVILLPATFGFIGYKLIYAYKINDLFGQAQLHWGPGPLLILALTGALMVLQWVLESKKWQLLISKNEETTFGNAFKGVLSGAALNILTPNQLGDFIGRIIFLNRTDKIKGTLVTVIGHTAQVIMTAAFGSYAFLWLLHRQAVIATNPYRASVIALSVLAVAAVACFLHIHVIAKLKITKRIADHLSVFRLYSKNELISVLVMSLLRYAIFTLQYYLLTRLFMVDVTPVECIVCVAAMMCAQSFVPSFVLIELGMRGASALWFFGMFTPQVAPVLLTTYVLWIINAMIPGIVGLFFLLRWRAAK